MANKVLSIVIDADIARSSGISEHPTSSSARLLLESVRKNGHTVAMSPDLLEEWKKHRSLFSSRWLASMVAKKKVKFIRPDLEVARYIEDNITDKREQNYRLQ